MFLTAGQKAAQTRKARQALAASLAMPSVSLGTAVTPAQVAAMQKMPDITGLNEQQLRSLGLMVHARLVTMSQAKAQAAMQKFVVGQRVRFTAKSGLPVAGKLISFGIKNCKVLADTGVRWNVFAGYLSAE